MESKKFWYSKTFWLNLLAAWAMICQAVIGQDIFDVEIQAAILAVINLILRKATNKPISWK